MFFWPNPTTYLIQTISICQAWAPSVFGINTMEVINGCRCHIHAHALFIGGEVLEMLHKQMQCLA